MKFRCVLSREPLSTLLSVTTALSKTGADGAGLLVLSPDTFRLSALSPDESSGGARQYAELSLVNFLEYRLESLQSVILLHCSLLLLAKALASGKASPCSVLKLVKRGALPCLCFETRSNDLQVVHDIAVRLSHAALLPSLSPPPLSPPKVALQLPGTRALKALLDKLGKFSPTLTLTGLSSGRLSLSVTGRVKLTSFLHHLPPLSLPQHQQDEGQGERERKVKVRVVARHLAQLFDFIPLPCGQVVLFLSSSTEPLLLFLRLLPEGAGTLSYYLPPLPLEDDEGDSDEEEEGEGEYGDEAEGGGEGGA